MPSILTAALGAVKVKTTVGGQCSPESDAWTPAQKWLFSSGQGQSHTVCPGLGTDPDTQVCVRIRPVCLLLILTAIRRDKHVFRLP